MVGAKTAETKVDAVVLSGGNLERERFTSLDPAIARKAQIPLLGRPMIEWVARGLRETETTRRIVVVGHPDLDTPELRALQVNVIPEVGEIAANLRAGLDALPASERLLVLSGDLPLLNRPSLEDLFRNAPEADVVFPVVERTDILRDYPNREWIYSHTPDGDFTGSSVCLCRPAVLRANWKWVEELLNARRKKPLALAAMFGIPFAIKLLFRRLRLEDAEATLSRLLHLSGRAYRTPFTELALDVDKFTDIALVEEVLRRRTTGSTR